MNIHLNFSLTAPEYNNLTRYLIDWRRYRWVLALVLVAVAIQLIFFDVVQGLIYLLVLVLWVLLFYFILRRAMRKGFETATHLQGPLDYQITDADFRVATGNSNTTFQWTIFQKVREVPEWFILQQNKMMYNFIPKRAFNSAAEMDEFRNFLLTKGLLKVVEKG